MHHPVQPDNSAPLCYRLAYAYCHRFLSFTVFPTDVIAVSLPTMNRISLEATDLPSIIGQGACSSSQKVAPVADGAQCAELPGIP